MCGVAGDEDVAVLHGRRHLHAQVDEGRLDELDVVQPTTNQQSGGQFGPHAPFGPIGNRVARRYLQVEPRQIREPTHLAGEPTRVCGVDRVGLQRPGQTEHSEPPDRQ